MSEQEEIAKAIQEASKLGTKGLEIAEKAGGFLTKIFKESISEISGMVTDRLKFIRWKRFVEISEEVDELLRQKNISQTRSVLPKIALPIIEAATLEDEPSLKSLWNNLLVNAMDPKFNSEIRYGFIDMKKNITAKEAVFLNEVYNEYSRNYSIQDFSKLYEYIIDRIPFTAYLKITANEYAISAHNLMRLQLISPGIIRGGLSYGKDKIVAYKGIEAISITGLGILFVQACMI